MRMTFITEQDIYSLIDVSRTNKPSPTLPSIPFTEMLGLSFAILSWAMTLGPYDEDLGVNSCVHRGTETLVSSSPVNELQRRHGQRCDHSGKSLPLIRDASSQDTNP